MDDEEKRGKEKTIKLQKDLDEKNACVQELHNRTWEMENREEKLVIKNKKNTEQIKELEPKRVSHEKGDANETKNTNKHEALMDNNDNEESDDEHEDEDEGDKSEDEESECVNGESECGNDEIEDEDNETDEEEEILDTRLSNEFESMSDYAARTNERHKPLQLKQDLHRNFMRAMDNMKSYSDYGLKEKLKEPMKKGEKRLKLVGEVTHERQLLPFAQFINETHDKFFEKEFFKKGRTLCCDRNGTRSAWKLVLKDVL